MDILKQLPEILQDGLAQINFAFRFYISALETWLRHAVGQLGLSPYAQNLVLVGAAILLAFLSLKLLRGWIRVAVVLILGLFAIHIAMPLFR